MVVVHLRDGHFIGDLNDVHGWSWNETPYIHEFDRETQTCTIDTMLENGLKYLYKAFQLNTIYASITNKKHAFMK